MSASRLAADEAGPTRRDVCNFGKIRADDEIVKLAYSVIRFDDVVLDTLGTNITPITMSGKLKTLNQISGASEINYPSVTSYV